MSTCLTRSFHQGTRIDIPTTLVTIAGTVVVFSTPLMLDFASWNDRSKKKTTTLGGKEHIFFVRKWVQHGVSQRNVTRIVGKH